MARLHASRAEDAVRVAAAPLHLELADVQFSDDQHVMNVATRIVTLIGRRVDETTPLVDARLPDGSRVNVIIPPLALDGPLIATSKKIAATFDSHAKIPYNRSYT